VARVVYTRYKVTLRGSVPLRPLADRDQPSTARTLEFRIEGEIKGAMLHGRRSRKFPEARVVVAATPGLEVSGVMEK
jgi:hypothetical protein